MMKNVKQFLAAVLLCLVSVTLFCVPVSADIGNSFDDGGWDAGGDFSGGYDYDAGGWDDYGYDYDVGGSYDYVYDSDYDGGGAVSPVLALVIVLLCVYIVYRRTKRGNGAMGSGGMNSGRMGSARSGSGSSGGIRQGNPDAQNLYGERVTDEDTVIQEIQENDPDFSASDFKAFVEDCYLRLTEAWEARDWTIARNFESDALFNIHRGQLDEYITQKKTNHMDGQCVLSKVLTAHKNDGKTETVVVRLNATLLDYVTDDESGEVLSGSKTQRYNRFYRLEFIRTAGTKTDASHGLTSHECPSCGAPLHLNATGICEYCQNVITSGDYTWVLNAYGRWN